MHSPVPVLKFLTKFAVGGTERQFVYLAKSIDRTRFDLRVGCLSREGEFLKDIESMNIPVWEYRIRSLYSPQMVHRQLLFARDLRHQGVRLVHAYGFYPNVFSIPAAKLAGCITIASVRDTGAFSSRIKLKTLSQKTACRLADRVIANSRAVRDWLIGLGINQNHIDVIPNGIAVEAPPVRSRDFPIRQQLGIDREVPLIAVVSRLNPRKGIEYFLEAAVRVGRRFPSARFLIVGGPSADPAYLPRLERQAQNLKLADRMIFTGERNDVKDLLKETDLVVLPSLGEGLSNALLEAMAAGLPVVATDVGGNPELVEDGRNGFLVPAGDAAALSAAMCRILESPETRRCMGDQGYLKVASHFSLKSTVRKTEDLYSNLLEQRGWRRSRPVEAA